MTNVLALVCARTVIRHLANALATRLSRGSTRLRSVTPPTVGSERWSCGVYGASIRRTFARILCAAASSASDFAMSFRAMS